MPDKIVMSTSGLQVPDEPIIPYIAGDGNGTYICAAAVRAGVPTSKLVTSPANASATSAPRDSDASTIASLRTSRSPLARRSTSPSLIPLSRSRRDRYCSFPRPAISHTSSSTSPRQAKKWSCSTVVKSA